MSDGAGDPVPDGLVETWQADPDGRFDHPDDPRGRQRYAGFRGFGRCPTDADGRFTIRTLKPGPLPAGDDGTEAPHLDLSVFARGLLNRVVTRLYFPDEAEANAADPVLRELRAEDACALIAVPQVDGTLRFDIHLQGPHETPFFRV
jgi:protocatechuate 3,4-dioxygenase alpha subunit